ncbi:MAG: cytochrome d ubiquinol oxidase subunit II [Blastocatellia bacterium]|nr:cytochrome d ubiquinol oxidase subunit II [Blastocatellia bacterium]
MKTFWFIAVAQMLTTFVILDGFDLGAGIIHHLVAKTDEEKRMILRAIGPVWDGNEVWLLAAGGTLFFSFPVLYAASFSGFYLPLMMVLWLLILRATGIELRGHLVNPLWRQFWDFIFTLASALLAIFFGAALGNVIRGVPLNADKVFFEPLWTDFMPGGQTGILDWYTVLIGLLAFVALVVHGANYIALKTMGEVQARAVRIGKYGGVIFTLLAVVSLIATLLVRPQMIDNYRLYPLGWIIPAIVVAGLAGLHYFRSTAAHLPAFLSSSACLAGMLAGTAFGLYPNLLPSTLNSNYNLTIWNSAAQAYGLRVGMIGWAIGIVLTTGYYVYLYYSFRGKVTLEGEGY